MTKKRKEHCFGRWDERFDEIVATQRRLLSSGLGFAALMRELEIGPREQKWFAEWVVARKHPPMTPAMRRHTSLHEAAHAVSAEMLIPGSVDHAVCYKEQRQNPHLGKEGHPHAQVAGYVRGTVEYVERTCREFSEKNATEYVARRIAVAQFAGVMEEKVGFQNGRGTTGDDATDEYHFGLAESDAERAALSSRARELVTQLSESPLVEQAVREVADRMYRGEVVSGAEIRAIIAEKQAKLKILQSSP